MPGIENILPPEHQFNTTLIELREPLVDELYDYIEEVGDVIDPKLEFSRPHEQYWGLSDGLARLFASENEDQESVRAAIYRGICFGFQVVEDVKTAPIEKISMDNWRNVDDVDDSAEAISADVQEYLSARPHVDSLIGMFASEVAGEYVLCEHHVEIAAGLVLMLCEREIAETFIDASVESVRPEDLEPRGLG